MMYTTHCKKLLLTISVLLLVIGFGALTAALITTKQTPSPQDETMQVPASQNVTISGRYGCLPKKNTGGPQTMECALGMLADDNNNYILDSEAAPGLAEMAMGGRFEVEGPLVPIEMLSTDQWKTYDVRGVVRVTDWKKL